MPMSGMMQVVYGITMLARWAKILGPGSSPRRGNAPVDILTSQKVVWDPAATRPAPKTMIGVGLAPVPSFDTESSRSTSPRSREAETRTDANMATGLGRTPSLITDPLHIPGSQFRETADPSIPSVVASLKAKLVTQPGLNLDIVGILATMAQRCEQAHKELTREGGGGAWHNDIWYHCAKKVLVVHAKLEKWAEIIASGSVSTTVPTDAAAQHANQSHGEREAQMGDADITTVADTQASFAQPPLCEDRGTLAAFQRQIETAGQGILHPESMDDAWQYINVWTDDMFDQLDPSLWLNDGSDWSMALLG